MIKFFRHIRKSLLDQNKTGKYLKYAIGEIVLVVIGILIALQINNWNEARKARLQEITILENIKGDIALDTLDLKFNITYHKIFLKAEKQLLDFLQNNLDQPKDSIDYNNAMGVPLVVVQHKSTFNNLQNNQIGLITNNKLHKEISRFYDFFNQAIQVIENDLPSYETYEGKKPYFKKYFKLDEKLYKFSNTNTNNEDYFNPDFEKSAIKLVDVKGAKNDEAFKIELNESIFMRQVVIGFYMDMMTRINELIVEIDQELERLRR